MTLAALWIAVQDMHSDVRPELAEGIRSGVAEQSVAVLRGEFAPGTVGARVVRGRNALRDAAADKLSPVDGEVAVVVGRHKDATNGVSSTLENRPATKRIVALVLMQYRGKCPNDPVVAIRLVDPATPGVRPETGNTLAERGMAVLAFSDR